MRIIFLKQVAFLLVVMMFILGISPRVDAELSPSEIINFTNVNGTAELEKIQKRIETKLIIEKLKKQGFTKQEIQARLSQLSNEQIHELALKIDELKVGGDGFEVVVVLLLIAILVVLWLQLTGRKVTITK